MMNTEEDTTHENGSKGTLAISQQGAPLACQIEQVTNEARKLRQEATGALAAKVKALVCPICQCEHNDKDVQVTKICCTPQRDGLQLVHVACGQCISDGLVSARGNPKTNVNDAPFNKHMPPNVQGNGRAAQVQAHIALWTRVVEAALFHSVSAPDIPFKVSGDVANGLRAPSFLKWARDEDVRAWLWWTFQMPPKKEGTNCCLQCVLHEFNRIKNAGGGDFDPWPLIEAWLQGTTPCSYKRVNAPVSDTSVHVTLTAAQAMANQTKLVRKITSELQMTMCAEAEVELARDLLEKVSATTLSNGWAVMDNNPANFWQPFDGMVPTDVSKLVNVSSADRQSMCQLDLDHVQNHMLQLCQCRMALIKGVTSVDDICKELNVTKLDTDALRMKALRSAACKQRTILESIIADKVSERRQTAAREDATLHANDKMLRDLMTRVCVGDVASAPESALASAAGRSAHGDDADDPAPTQENQVDGSSNAAQNNNEDSNDHATEEDVAGSSDQPKAPGRKAKRKKNATHEEMDAPEDAEGAEHSDPSETQRASRRPRRQKMTQEQKDVADDDKYRERNGRLVLAVKQINDLVSIQSPEDVEDLARRMNAGVVLVAGSETTRVPKLAKILTSEVSEEGRMVDKYLVTIDSNWLYRHFPNVHAAKQFVEEHVHEATGWSSVACKVMDRVRSSHFLEANSIDRDDLPSDVADWFDDGTVQWQGCEERVLVQETLAAAYMNQTNAEDDDKGALERDISVHVKIGLLMCGGEAVERALTGGEDNGDNRMTYRDEPVQNSYRLAALVKWSCAPDVTTLYSTHAKDQIEPWSRALTFVGGIVMPDASLMRMQLGSMGKMQKFITDFIHKSGRNHSGVKQYLNNVLPQHLFPEEEHIFVSLIKADKQGKQQKKAAGATGEEMVRGLLKENAGLKAELEEKDKKYQQLQHAAQEMLKLCDGASEEATPADVKSFVQLVRDMMPSLASGAGESSAMGQIGMTRMSAESIEEMLAAQV